MGADPPVPGPGRFCAAGPFFVYTPVYAVWGHEFAGRRDTRADDTTAFNGQLPDWVAEPRRHSRRRGRTAQTAASPAWRQRSRITESACQAPTCVVAADPDQTFHAHHR